MRSILPFPALLILLCAAGSGQKPAASRTTPRAGAVADTTALTEKALRSVVLLIVSAHGEPIGQGSGFVVSRDGKIITNYHVIQYADSAILKFPNGAFYAVEGILASHPAHDVAILKAAGKEFPFLPLGKSQAVRVGQPVLAVGSPLALEGTVSTGIVSGIRNFSDGAYKVIPTTASISPGSSGGALLNMKGEAIGITTFRLVQGENLNFAVPIDYVKGLLASNEVTPLKGQTQGGLCVAEGKADERKGATQSSVTEPQKAPDLSRKWINVGDGTVWSVRVDGGHLYGICQLAEGPDLTIHDGGFDLHAGEHWL